MTFVGTAAPVPVRILRPVGLILRGTFLLPEAAKGRVPGVLLLSGSGPTDRNGNQLPAIASDLLEQIAERLGIFDPAGGIFLAASYSSVRNLAVITLRQRCLVSPRPVPRPSARRFTFRAQAVAALRLW